MPLLFSLRRRLAKLCIALFCLWHMAAILIWIEPTNYHHSRILEWLRNQIPYVRPYILTTSQWQKWNVFPVGTFSTVSQILLERMDKEIWKTMRTIDSDHLSFFRQAPEVVVITRMVYGTLDVVKEPYMQDLCRTEHLDPGTPVRMRWRHASIPPHTAEQNFRWWRAWNPEWAETIVFSTTCTKKL